MITRATLSTIEQGLPKYRSMLAGNPAYNPEVTSGFYSIATVSPSGTGTVTFSSIPQIYKHLQIRCKWTDGGQNSLVMRCNGISTATYTTSSLEGQASGSTGSAVYGGTGMLIAFRSYGGSDNTTDFAGTLIEVNNYRDTNKQKTVLSSYGFLSTTTGASGFAQGLFPNTSAITSITLSTGGTFSAGTVFALYGIGG